MSKTLLVFLIDGRFAQKVLQDMVMAAEVPVSVRIRAEQSEITAEDLEQVEVIACSLDTATHVRRLGWEGTILGVLTWKPNAGTIGRMATLGITQHEVYRQFRPFHTPQAPVSRAA